MWSEVILHFPRKKNAVQKAAKCLDLNVSFFNFKIGQDRLFYPVEVFVASVTTDLCLMQYLVLIHT